MPATRCARGPSLGAATLAERTEQKRRFPDRHRRPGDRERRPSNRAGPGTAYPRTAWSAGAPVSDRHRPPRGGRNRVPPFALTGRRQGNADLRPVLPVGAGTAARRAAAAWTLTVGMAPFSARTPEDRVARRPGNRVPPTAKKRGDGQERRCSHRHRAGARNPHRWRCVIPCPSSACAHPGWRDHPSLPSPRRRGRRKRHPRVAPGGAGPVTSRAGTRGRRATSSSRRPARPI